MVIQECGHNVSYDVLSIKICYIISHSTINASDYNAHKTGLTLALSVKFSADDTNIFLIFPRKQVLTFHANCLQWRQFAWTVIFCFLRKNKKTIISLSSAELAQRDIKVTFLILVQFSWNCHKNVGFYVWSWNKADGSFKRTEGWQERTRRVASPSV